MNKLNEGEHIEFTHEINAHEMLDLYEKDEKFKEIIKTGNFIFCENRVVLGYEKYITVRNGKTVLADYAKNNESECCLIFTVNEQY